MLTAGPPAGRLSRAGREIPPVAPRGRSVCREVNGLTPCKPSATMPASTGLSTTLLPHSPRKRPPGLVPRVGLAASLFHGAKLGLRHRTRGGRATRRCSRVTPPDDRLTTGRISAWDARPKAVLKHRCTSPPTPCRAKCLSHLAPVPYGVSTRVAAPERSSAWRPVQGEARQPGAASTRVHTGRSKGKANRAARMVALGSLYYGSDHAILWAFTGQKRNLKPG